jgi:transcriptional regulator with XRE-family HTH domain
VTELTLVPPRRLGRLLADARSARGEDLDTVARRAGFEPATVAAIEAGERPVSDREIHALLGGYGVDPGELVPDRTELVVDLDEHLLAAGGEARSLGAPTADEVLTTYLSLVYTLRRATPGTTLVLRDADVDVLARVLELTGPEVERRLHELMVEPDGAVRRRMGALRARVLVPVVGVVVAATAVGVVLLVARGGERPAGAPEPAVVAEVPAELGPASFEIRGPDGSSQQVIVGEGIPADQLPPGAVNLGEAQTAVRNPDGSVSQFPTPAEPDPSSTP